MSNLPTYHIYHNGIPFTYLVFGPYNGPEYDVEVYKGHVEYPAPMSEYVGTVSSLTRDSHIVVDVWDWMDANV